MKMAIGYGPGQRSVMIAMGPGILIMPAGEGRGEGATIHVADFNAWRMRKRRGGCASAEAAWLVDGLVG